MARSRDEVAEAQKTSRAHLRCMLLVEALETIKGLESYRAVWSARVDMSTKSHSYERQVLRGATNSEKLDLEGEAVCCGGYYQRVLSGVCVW